MRIFHSIALVLAVGAGSAARVAAQSPSPSPAPSLSSVSPPPAAYAPAVMPDFSGTWTLDRKISDDPAQANFDAVSRQNQSSNRRGGGGFGGRGGFGRGGYGGGSSGGYGGGSSSRTDTPAALTQDEKTRLLALTNQLKTASATLTIAHHDPNFVTTDAQGFATFFETNAAKEDHTIGAATVSSTTHWQEDRIVVEYAISARRTLVYTYTLLPRTHQLVLRVQPQFADASGGSAGAGTSGQELKLVYTLKASPDK